MAFGDFKGVPFFDSQELPEPTAIPLDVQTQEMIDQTYKRATQDTADAQKQSFSGIDQAASGYGMLGGINDAIKNKYGRILGQDVGFLKNQESLNLRKDQSNRYKMAQQALLAQQQVTNDAFARQMQAYNMREAARAQAIGSIIQIGAMAGGFAFAGPVGGMAASAATSPGAMGPNNSITKPPSAQGPSVIHGAPMERIGDY